jgi:hypothetical protein
MANYVNESWRQVLDLNQLGNFDALWQLQAGWFEPPNQRRGGWSGVARYELPKTDDQPRVIFLKRQENHKCNSWRHPIAGIPTFQREFERIQHFRACGVPTLEPVYFAMERTAGGHRAILATAELTGYSSLEDWVRQWQESGPPPPAIRRRLIAKIADLARTMHVHRIQHNCFYPKHIFVRIAPDGDVDARVIDLEKSRWQPSIYRCTLRDLDTLNRQLQRVTRRSDRLRLILAYLQTDRLTPQAKQLWRKLVAMAAKKRRTLA